MTTSAPPSLPPTRRVGKRQTWRLPNTLDDPAIGLGFDAMTDLLRATGVPAGWSAKMASELSEATHCVISRVIGEATQDRKMWANASGTLADVCCTDYLDVDEFLHDTPFVSFAEARMEMRGRQGFGFGTGCGALRRLHEHTKDSDGGFAHIVARRHEGPWRPKGPRDHQALDQAWKIAVSNARRRARLPVTVCAAFAPPARPIEGPDGPMVAPSFWQMVAVLLIAGPDETEARLIALLGDRADRLSADSLSAKASDLHRWALAAHAVSAGFPRLLASWQERPVRTSLGKVQATISERKVDRRAVPLLLVRRARLELIAQVEGRRRRDGSLRPDRSFTVLRDLVMLDLIAQTGARVCEIADIRPRDVLFAWRWDDADGSYTAPAVIIHVAQKGRGGYKRARVPMVQPIAAQTARYLRDWLTFTGLQPEDENSIWLSRACDCAALGASAARTAAAARMPRQTISSRLAGSKSERSQPILPRPGGGGYSANTLRHLNEALAYAVGVEWLRGHDEWTDRVSAQVFADAHLTHKMCKDALGYRDLEANRPLWMLRAGIGDPDRGVPGVIELISGDAGARRGWELDSIRDAVMELNRAHEALNRADQQAAALRLARRALREQPLPYVPSDLSTLSGDERMELLLRRDAARERHEREHWRLDDDIEQADKDRTSQKASLVACEEALRHIERNGRRTPIHDGLPTHAELTSRGEVGTALDAESWEQALDRIDVAPIAVTPSPATPSTRIREELNLNEFAAVLGITDGTLRKRLRGATRPLFPLTGDDSPLVIVGDRDTSRRRYIIVNKLPASFMRRLLPEQREMIEELLAVPMGSTRWAGPRMTSR